MMPRNCNFCGLCCTLVVKVTDKEVKAIENLGHKDFTQKDPDNNTILKRPDGWCNFLGKKGDIAYCKIYKDRPSPCRDFPGEICGLKDNVIFSDMSNKPKKVQELWKKAPKKTDIPKEEPKFPLKKLP